MKAWIHSHCRGDLLSENDVVESLTKEGLNTYVLGSDSPDGPGIVFFDNLDQKLIDFYKEISFVNNVKVLFIATSLDILTDSCVWSLLKAGASDVLAWDQLENSSKEVLARFKRWDEIDQIIESSLVQDFIIGKSPTWKSILREVVEVAIFTDASALITGETGTGKELIARLIHSLDRRTEKRDLVVLDCTTIQPELSGSEFFGHEKGAFTGAITSRDGAFALANEGTLFLDEVGDLPAGLQAQLLRVIQEHTYKRVGCNTWQSTDFRLICATNKDLVQEVKDGRFRSDLYYRIAGFVCKLPLLCERIEDILLLAKFFIKQFRLRPENDESCRIDRSVCEYLLKRDYPGNIRDLKQLCAQISYRTVGDYITLGSIPKEMWGTVQSGAMSWQDENFKSSIHKAVSLGVGLKEIGRTAEAAAVRAALVSVNGKLKDAARKLGVTERTLQMRRATLRNQRQA